MLKKYTLVLGALVALVSSVNAVPEWRQCGGVGFAGPTVCDAGLTCVYHNQFYSQCLRVSSSSVPPSSTSSIRPSSSSIRSSSSSISSSSTTKPVSSSVTTSAVSACPTPTNPYLPPYEGYISPIYASEVASAAASIPDPGLYSQALKVKDIPVFIWLDTLAKVPSLDTYLADARAQQTATGKKLIVQLVLYNLPGRDCHATTSYGELSIANNGEALYKQFIDTIASIISKYPDVRVVIVFEPGSLPTLITNLSDPRCANAAPVYRSLTVYALKKLYYCHVWVYLDAGHSRWLGWPANLPPAAQLFASIYNASLPNRVRGLSTNVGNYNPLVTTVPDPNIYLPDEIKYIEALAPLLTQNGFPAHFIVDTGRNGVDNIRDDWNNSCNIEGAGLGVRPTPSTGHPLIDAFVWIKPPGESDGTSDITSPRYDTTCGSADAKKPSPEAGQWFQAHFVDLVRNANPPL